MEALRLLEAAPFGSDTINVLKQAFEEAWASIGPTIAPDRTSDIRISLVHAIVAHAGAGEIDCEMLKIAALEAVQKHPPRKAAAGR
jgi:hypothetical protein